MTQYLNGIVGEPLPFWSRMVGSTWYLQKLKVGRYVTKEDMGRIKKAEKAAFGAEPQPAPEPFGGSTAAEPTAAEPAAAEPVAAAVPEAKPKKPAARRTAVAAEPKPTKATGRAKKATTAAASEPVAAAPPPADPPLEGPVAIVEAKPAEEVSTILRIQVKKTEIQGRSVYLEPTKDKVYDTKFRYLGRFDRKEGKIVSFPDSDQER